jgi:hypothetical protein
LLFLQSFIGKHLQVIKRNSYFHRAKIAKAAEVKAARLTTPVESVIERNLTVDDKTELLPENDRGS